MVTRRIRKTKDDGIFNGNEDIPPAIEESKVSQTRVVHIEPTEFILTLNTAVSSINAVFQMRDLLTGEIAQLKEELGIAKDVRVEKSRLESMRREQENFEYEFNLRKERMEEELNRLGSDRREQIKRMEEETKENLKAQTDEQIVRLKMQASEYALKLKTEREDHERKIKLEREDFERARTLFEQERTTFETRVKSFEADRNAMRERLVQELNHDNEHQIKVNSLNHQREIEILRSQLKLEQASVGKFESLLKDSRVQNDKFAEQISTLSREALASASSSAMAVKLNEIITQLTPQTKERAS